MKPKKKIALIIAVIFVSALMAGCATQVAPIQEESAPVTANVLPLEEPAITEEEPEPEIETVELVLPIEAPEDFLWDERYTLIEYMDAGLDEGIFNEESIPEEIPDQISLDFIQNYRGNVSPAVDIYYFYGQVADETEEMPINETPSTTDAHAKNNGLPCFMNAWTLATLEDGLNLRVYGAKFVIDCETGAVVDEEPIADTEGIYPVSVAFDEDGLIYYITLDAETIDADSENFTVEEVAAEDTIHDDLKADNSGSGNSGIGSSGNSGNSDGGSSNGGNSSGDSGDNSGGNTNPTPEPAQQTPEPAKPEPTSEPAKPTPKPEQRKVYVCSYCGQDFEKSASGVVNHQSAHPDAPFSYWWEYR